MERSPASVFRMHGPTRYLSALSVLMARPELFSFGIHQYSKETTPAARSVSAKHDEDAVAKEEPNESSGKTNAQASKTDVAEPVKCNEAPSRDNSERLFRACGALELAFN
jgi:hypothetical protein